MLGRGVGASESSEAPPGPEVPALAPASKTQVDETQLALKPKVLLDWHTTSMRVQIKPYTGPEWSPLGET